MRKKIQTSVTSVVHDIDKTVLTMEKEVGSVIKPLQRTVFARFPVLFTLLATFGLVITLLGLERIINDITFINDRPVLMLGIGLGVLTLTGTLYKKLG